jgi:hypothetical protein
MKANTLLEKAPQNTRRILGACFLIPAIKSKESEF